MSSTAPATTLVNVDENWVGVGAVFGGHVATLLLRAADSIDGLTPIAATIHFTGSVRAGEATLTVRPVHVGGSTASVSAVLEQDHPRASALVKLIKLDAETIWNQSIDLANLPAPEFVGPTQQRYGNLPYEKFIELRTIDGAPPFESRGWVRLREPLQNDGMLQVCQLLDVLPPGPFQSEPSPSFVPTIEFTVHLVPGASISDEWYFVAQRMIWSDAQSCIEESDVYSGSGQLVARARQARRILA